MTPLFKNTSLNPGANMNSFFSLTASLLLLLLLSTTRFGVCHQDWHQRPCVHSSELPMEEESMVHSDSMSPASLGICEKLFQMWEFNTSLMVDSTRQSQQTLIIYWNVVFAMDKMWLAIPIIIPKKHHSGSDHSSQSHPSSYHCHWPHWC